MKLCMYAIYDIKAEAYLTPFFSPNAQLALRMFMQAGADTNSNIHQYPADFTLFEIGEFEQDHGTLTAHQALLNMGTALSHLTASAQAELEHADLPPHNVMTPRSDHQ